MLRASSATRQLEWEKVDVDVSQLKEIQATNILVKLAQWPEIFQLAYKTHEPVTVLAYLWTLTHAINSSYDDLNVIYSEPAVKLARLALYTFVRGVLQASVVRLLGPTLVER